MSAYEEYKAAQDKQDRLEMVCDELDSAKFHAALAGEQDMSWEIDKLLDAAREKKEKIDGELEKLAESARWENDEELARMNREYERSV